MKLHYIENYWAEVNKRVFGLTAEGNVLETGLDIYAEAGKGFALLKNYNGIVVLDSVLNLNFKSLQNIAMLAAIEIIPQGANFNTAPVFSLSGDLYLQEDFVGTEVVSVIPDAVPAADSAQTVTYSLDPASVAFADIQFDSNTGKVEVNALAGKYGSQTFVLTADDGQAYNNTHSETFVLEVASLYQPNTPPSFSLSGNISVFQDFQSLEIVNLTPDDVNDIATYSISPASVPFANIVFDSITGNVEITSVAGAFGTQVFTITADDGEANDNLYSENFTLTVIQSGSGNVLRINSGGESFINGLGQYFMADTFYSGAGLAYSWGPVSGSNDQELYRYGRHGWGTTLAYNVPLAADTYSVVLHFAETHFQDAGKRVFNVSVEGQQVLTNLDVFAEAGYRNAYPVNLSNIVVSDGELNIQFASLTNVAQIQGIEIIGKGSGYVPPYQNTAPSFSLSGDLTLTQDFANTEYVTITPDPVPAADSGQVVTYSLSPSSVNFAKISFDTNTGNISVDSITGASGSQVFTLTANDGQATNNIHSETFTLIVQAELVAGAIRINCGGPEYLASNGAVFSADQYYTSGNVSTTWKPILGTDDATIFQSDRYNWGNNLKYEIPVAQADTYTVRLYFAEFFFTEDGKRVSDVSVEGQLRLPNYDIHAVAGYSNAVIEEFTDVIVTDGVLNIDFSTKTYLSKVSAIEIYKTDDNAPAVNKLQYYVSSIAEKDALYAEMSNIYPNPGNDYFVLEMENAYQGNISVEIYDLLGKKHAQMQYEKSDTYLKRNIETGNLASGFYIIRMRGEDFELSKKWQKL